MNVNDKAAASTRPVRRDGPQLTLLLPSIALAAILVAIFVMKPNALSYNGMHILFRLSPILMLAAMAQLFIIAASDIDLGIGPFVAMVNTIAATLLATNPLLGVLVLVGCVGAYALMGAVIHVFRLPSIVVTLGASFIWLGAALMILPTAGGDVPEWLVGLLGLKPPLAPLPLYVAVGCGLFGYIVLKILPYGAILRGVGNNPAALERAGRSSLVARTTLYALAGFFAVLAGLAVSGLSTTGDANVGRALTLLSIAAVIVGGGEFFGGTVSPAGAMVGALVMLMTATILTFLSVPADWQFSVQGAILIAVLAGRAITRRRH